MKGIIIYKGKYGATQQYATWLSAALSIPVVAAGKETKDQLEDADYIIMGTSIYIGKLQLRDWVKKNQGLLAGKKLFLYLVAGTPVAEKEKLEGYITANIVADISNKCTCFFLPGKLEFRKLSWVDKCLLTIGARLAKGRGESIRVADYNDVKVEYLSGLIASVHKLSEVSV
ncbi:menaquinone-dependent protoporphyrinogen IX oxidase [Chitinophaga polysaccharea]|uniref:Menaquinone-dependent protoporphyrinogen IX oxidase n=1 Tax=Chitinophaga polysaccharea TaxID=1293035 RepID=A0A561P9T1_9BACT|nr:flavodoxin domain-containing protein [Chitinophaga polysaccharea]TWF34828.1 menaquinone-dependent protoporphyrinogen IX oxidase [Chitinophaga polysaccharea]